FIEDLYEIWLQDPSGVSSEWNAYFAALKGSPTRDVPHSAAIARIEAAQRQGVSRTAPVASAVDNVEAQKQAGVLKLVTAYRSRGHLAADLDPLDLANTFGKEELAALGLLPRPAA